MTELRAWLLQNLEELSITWGECPIMDELLKWGGWVAAAIMGVITIRGTISFDVNKWLSDRREQKKENIRALCPHARPEMKKEKLFVIGTFVSPSGTEAWQCQACGSITYDDTEVNRNTKYWASNPEKFVERIKKINELTKKL